MARPPKYAEKTVQISIRLPERMVQKLDRDRKDLSRGDFIRRKLMRKVNHTPKTVVPLGCHHPIQKRFAWGTLCTRCGARL